MIDSVSTPSAVHKNVTYPVSVSLAAPVIAAHRKRCQRKSFGVGGSACYATIAAFLQAISESASGKLSCEFQFRGKNAAFSIGVITLDRGAHAPVGSCSPAFEMGLWKHMLVAFGFAKKKVRRGG